MIVFYIGVACLLGDAWAQYDDDYDSVTGGSGGSSVVQTTGPCPFQKVCAPPVHLQPKSYRYQKSLVFPPTGYDPGARPTACPACPVTVYISLFLVNLGGIRTDSSTVQLGWRLEFSWFDPALAWMDGPNRNQTEGLAYIYVDSSSIWTPHVVFDYTAVEAHKQGQPDVLVEANGRVVFSAFYTVRVVANLKIAAFPFDSQRIYTRLTFAPVDEDHLRIQLVARTLTDQYDLNQNLFESTEWNIKEQNCYSGRYQHVEDNWYPTPPTLRRNTTAFVLCRTDVARKAGFYIVNFVVPALMITFLGITGQFTHELRSLVGAPPNKTQIALAAVMSLGVLTIAMGNTVPRESALTRLHSFYFLMICLTITASFTSAIRLPAVFPPPPGAPEGEERVQSPLWQWRFQASLLGAHLVALFSSVAYFSQPPAEHPI